MSTSPEHIAAIATIAAAIVAGLVSFIVTVLSKEQKTSEFRQAWIDALRSDIADFVAKNAVFMAAIRMQGQRINADEDLSEYLLQNRLPEMLDVETTRTRILLRINPIEHAKLMQLVNNVYGKSGVAKPDEHSSLEARIEALIQESQKALKTEWRRVKRGEPIYVITKWVSLLATLAAVAVAIANLAGRISPQIAP